MKLNASRKSLERKVITGLTAAACMGLLLKNLIFSPAAINRNALESAQKEQSAHPHSPEGCKGKIAQPSPLFQDLYKELRNSSITRIEHPVQEIQNLVDAIKLKGGHLIIATANIAHLDFVLNWRESIRTNLQLEKHLLVVCLDDELVVALKQHGIHTLKSSQLIDVNEDLHGLEKKALHSEQAYGSENYNQLVNMKIDVAYIFLRYYSMDYLIYSDVDMVWLQPRLLDYFDMLLSPNGLNYDILISPGGYSGPSGSFYPCTGFYVMKKNSFPVSFLGAILAYPDKREMHDQLIALKVFQNLPPDMKVRIHGLDAVLFIDGSTKDWSSYYGVLPWIFHANYAVGIEGKTNMLKEFGYWYL